MTGAIVRVIDQNGFFTTTPLSGFQNFDMTNKLVYTITIPGDNNYQYYHTYKV